MKAAKKHHRRNCLPIYGRFPYQIPVFWRRVEWIYGADHASFSLKHPDLDMAVEGYKQRLAMMGRAAGAAQ